MLITTATQLAQVVDAETSADPNALGFIIFGVIVVGLGTILWRGRQRSLRRHYESKRRQKEYEERLRNQPDLE